MLYELILINEIEQRAKIIFLSAGEKSVYKTKQICGWISIFKDNRKLSLFFTGGSFFMDYELIF